jgi:hypothetical protein
MSKVSASSLKQEAPSFRVGRKSQDYFWRIKANDVSTTELTELTENAQSD